MLTTCLLQWIDTGSSKPLIDLVSYGFVFSYAYSWPREYAHYKHEQVRALGLPMCAAKPSPSVEPCAMPPACAVGRSDVRGRAQQACSTQSRHCRSLVLRSAAADGAAAAEHHCCASLLLPTARCCPAADSCRPPLLRLQEAKVKGGHH